MALGQHAAASAGRGVGQRIAASTGRLAQRERVLGAGRGGAALCECTPLLEIVTIQEEM
jgi:hypothetical protein